MTCPHIYHAEHYWPWPYMCTDRQCVLDMMRTQEANGWLSETTLYEYHFNPETNELTQPGKMQLSWILENVPANYRSVWVQQAEDPAASQQRMQQRPRGRLARSRAPICRRFRSAWPCRRGVRPSKSTAIRRKELETIPTPRIPLPTSAAGSSSTSPGTGSGGGGSGGGGGAGY